MFLFWIVSHKFILNCLFSSLFPGGTTVQGCIGHLLPLWKSSFPRSTKEAEIEKNRGDAFTWLCTLEARAGALTSMAMFVEYCPSLMTDHIIRTIIQAVECSLVTISQ